MLGTPPTRSIATALPLLEGGPRQPGACGADPAVRASDRAPRTAKLPAAWAERWASAYGAGARRRDRAALGSEPPLDLTLRDASETALWAERLGGTSLLPGHVRAFRAGE